MSFRDIPRMIGEWMICVTVVRVAITNSLVTQRSALKDIKKLKSTNYKDLWFAFRAIDGCAIWKIKDLPAGAVEELMKIRTSYVPASKTYHTATEQRQGLTRKKVGATPELLEPFRAVLQQTLEDFIRWLERAQPDEDKKR